MNPLQSQLRELKSQLDRNPAALPVALAEIDRYLDATTLEAAEAEAHFDTPRATRSRQKLARLAELRAELQQRDLFATERSAA